MANEKRPTQTFGQRQKRIVLLLMALAGLAPGLLVSTSSLTPYTDGFLYYAAYALAAYGVTTAITRSTQRKRQIEDMSALSSQLAGYVQAYNGQVRVLKARYNDEKRLALFGSSKRELRKQYSSQYDSIKRDFERQKSFTIQEFQQRLKPFYSLRSLWGWTFAIILCSMVTTCIGSMVNDGTHMDSPSTTARQQGEATYWNADNIPIPYLKDATQYVSNPDHVLSQPAVDRINVTMKQVEDSFNVQSVIIVVNHIEGDDPFRLAQDVGNRYGVGYDDRGLMVVVGYEDHSVNISPGRSLEGDLTDAECHHLEQQYVVPAMRAELPDSAMVYLCDAIYATLQGKELPEMMLPGDEEDNMATAMGLYTCLLFALLIAFVYKNKRYQWMGGAAAMTIMANPFAEIVVSSGFTGGGGFGGGGFSGGGGGGFSGGSFGGGSFGGGGATSRW